MLDPADDMRHALRGAHTRESLYVTVPLPDDGLSIHAYWWVDALNRAGHVVSIFEDDDERMLFDRRDDIDMAGRDFDDWQVAGLRVRHLVPLEVAELDYRSDAIAFDVRFEALHRAFPYSENACGCPPAMADDRFEQAGRVQGTLTLGARRIVFDTTGHRDHSWGRRDYRSMHHFKWISVQAGEATALNAFQLLAGGEQTINGYVWQNGLLSPVVSMATSVEYDDVFAPRVVHSTIGDVAGRSLVVEATRFSHLRWDAPPIVMDDLGCRAHMDGRAGTGHVGLAWTQAYIDGQNAQP